MSSHPEALFAAAAADFEAGRLDAAETALERLAGEAPEVAAVWHLRGLVALEDDRPADAAGHLARAVDLEAGDARLFDLLGVAERRAGRPAESVAALSRARALAPDDARIAYNLGNALRDAEAPEEAAAAYRRATRAVTACAGAAFVALGLRLAAAER